MAEDQTTNNTEENVAVDAVAAPSEEKKAEASAEPSSVAPKAEPEPVDQTEEKPVAETKEKSETEAKSEDKPVAKAEDKPAAKVEKEPVAKAEAKVEEKPAAKVEKSAAKAEAKPAAKAEKKPAATKEKAAAKTKDKAEKKEKPAAKKKKPPPIEKKPFPEFIEVHFLPGLTEAFEKQGVDDLKLTFEDNEVTGVWQNGDRQFTVYFLEKDIVKKKAFTCSTKNAPATIIESFMIDERKMTLGLLVFGVIQRINAQKWFGSDTLSTLCN
ncbi:MAG: DUF2996 domain-containing protein [Cyanobacteria bacterium P01_F01_bin.42]